MCGEVRGIVILDRGARRADRGRSDASGLGFEVERRPKLFGFAGKCVIWRNAKALLYGSANISNPFSRTYNRHPPTKTSDLDMNMPSPTLLVSICFAVLSITAGAQRFADWPLQEYDHPELSAKCASALETTISCPTMLDSFAVLSEMLDSTQLAMMCTTECVESLQIVRNEILASCTDETDVLVVNGIAYPATYWAEKYIHAQAKSCLKDS